MATKKKIAVFTNGWSPEFIQLVMAGMRKYSDEHTVDIHTFISYASDSADDEEKNGEFNIFKLPDLSQYDGLIVLANTFCQYERTNVEAILKSATIPTVCLEYEYDGLHFIGSDNYSGMYELAEHVFRDHDIHDILYISGPADNAEARERLRAVTDAANKYDVPITKDNIIYGDWSFYSAVNILNDYLAVHDKLPQAIMCGNDAMAIGLCEKLAEYGYSVPNDVVVTGFDALESGSNYFPSMTSVGRNWDHMGYDAISFLLEEAPNTKEPVQKILNSSLSIGESCGCTLCKEKAEKRLLATKANGQVHSVNVTFDMHLRVLYSRMYGVQKESEMHESVSYFTVNEKEPYETDYYCLCLDPNFFETSDEEASLLCSDGYAEKLHTTINIYNRNVYGIEEISPKDLLPSTFKKTEKPQILFFSPMHIKGKNIGYSAMKAENRHLHEYSLFIWSRHLMQNFELLHQNIRIQKLTDQLTSLSISDGLTGLYNRNGCNKLTVPYFTDGLYKKKSMALIMCDVDCMKEINDIYGHLQGDLALCTLSSAIKESIPEGWHACRFGGDEFLIAGECANQKTLDKVTKTIEKNLKKEIKQAHLPYNLVSSLGSVLILPDKPISFDAALKLADSKMYAIKGEHKEKTGGTIR